MTETGLLVGTPAYMAPEQFRGQIADAQSDQFSFCVALYEALYGQRPFAGATMSELADNVIHGRVRPAPPNRRVPSWVRRALLRGLSVDSSERWPSMDALLAALAHNPNARGWWYALGGVVVASATAAALAVGMAPAQPSICQVSADRFAGDLGAGGRPPHHAAIGHRGVDGRRRPRRARATPSTSCRGCSTTTSAAGRACTRTRARRPTCAASSRTRCWTSR